MRCLECGTEVPLLDNEHLEQCCGLTLQEYALRYKLPLDILVPPSQINATDNPVGYRYPKGVVSDEAKLIISVLDTCGVLFDDNNFHIICGEVRRLDFLFWLQQALLDYGFEFRQEYIYNDETHRVVALNRLKTPKRSLNIYKAKEWERLNDADFLNFVALSIAIKAEFYGGYLFLRYRDISCTDWVCHRLQASFKVQLIRLDAIGGSGALLRSKTMADSRTLLHLIESILNKLPCTSERFYPTTPKASVTKELVFDSAHFITDHPGSCANLHGGRYKLNVTISDFIDPYNGFVMDYGYLKAVIVERVIKKLDHKNLNLSDTSLSWRSSTELLNTFIWQQLIDYLPNLLELLIYETDSSYCRFSGPSLEDLQNGTECMPSAFEQKQLGHAPVRRRALNASHPIHLDLVTNEDKL